MELKNLFRYSYQDIPSLTYLLIVISAVSLGTIISLNDNDSTPDTNVTNANNDTNANANANNDTNNNYDNDGDNSGANDANPSSYVERVVESITPQFGGNGKRKSNRNTTRKHTKK